MGEVWLVKAAPFLFVNNCKNPLYFVVQVLNIC